MNIKLTKEAERDYKKIIKNGQKSSLKRIVQIFEELEVSPREGIGQPERLKHFKDKEVWSRKIDKKNRIKFIDPDGMEVVIGDFYDRQGRYLGTDGIDDGKIYLLNKGMRAKFENKAVNWGGSLSEASVSNLKENSIQVGGLIIQNRIEEGNDYTISEFETVGGEQNVTGYMLEPAGPSTTTPNQDRRIPEGVYNIENYSSKKYPNNFLLSNEDFPKERLILYHSGNYGHNTEGCNMPGATKGEGFVGNSKKKVQELRVFSNGIGAENVLTIINNKIEK